MTWHKNSGKRIMGMGGKRDTILINSGHLTVLQCIMQVNQSIRLSGSGSYMGIFFFLPLLVTLIAA